MSLAATRPRFLLAILLVTGTYFAAGKFGLGLAFLNQSATPVWPPSGIAIAALLVLGLRLWPAVFAGAFLVNLSTAGSPAASAGIAVGNTLEALVAAILINGVASGAAVFERPGGVLRFALIAPAAAAVAASIGVASLAIAGFAPVDEFVPIWLTWWLGDLSGALIVTPLIVLVARDRTLASPQRGRSEGLLLAGALLLSGTFVFGNVLPLGILHYPLEFLTFPVLVWAAYRFGPTVTSAVVLGLSALAIAGTLQGSGPFAIDGPNDSLLVLQVFMATASTMSLVLAAAVLDRQRVEESVHAMDRRSARIAEEAARSREEFMSIATHELRTPVTALKGYAQIALRAIDDRDQKVRPALQTILRQSDRLAALITQLLDASRVQSGRMTMQPVRTDISQLVNAAVEAARLLGPKHHWEVDIQPELEGDVDPLRWEQVLTNLLDNAIKFTPANRRITVRLAAVDEIIRLQISDDGLGIPRERLAQVFDRFYLAHPEQGLGGLGLGLYITKELVERHGGTIGVTSQSGEGSTFTVTLRRSSGVRRARPASAPAKPRPAAVRVEGETPHVLVIDDDASIRELVGAVLRELGLRVTTATDGMDALEVVARDAPDLIVLDQLMPRMDGTAFASAYRQTEAPAPIIAFCAARNAAEWAASIDALDHLTKPFDVTDLERAVLSALSPARPQEESVV